VKRRSLISVVLSLQYLLNGIVVFLPDYVVRSRSFAVGVPLLQIMSMLLFGSLYAKKQRRYKICFQ